MEAINYLRMSWIPSNSMLPDPTSMGERNERQQEFFSCGSLSFAFYSNTLPYIMNLIAFIGIITVLFGATLALVQKDIKRSLAYSTMSQLGYMMLVLGIGSYRAALFHLITRGQ